MQVFKPELKAKYAYCPLTGNVYRLVRCGKCLAGSVCSSKSNGGKYLKVEDMLVHRLAWFLHTGEQPPSQIDHINGDGVDNRWDNLRCADYSTNQMNTGVTKKSSTGVKGVYPVKRGGAFCAEIRVNGVRLQKYSKDLQYLKQWVTAKRKELHGQYAHD